MKFRKTVQCEVCGTRKKVFFRSKRMAEYYLCRLCKKELKKNGFITFE